MFGGYPVVHLGGSAEESARKILLEGPGFGKGYLRCDSNVYWFVWWGILTEGRRGHGVQVKIRLEKEIVLVLILSLHFHARLLKV